MADRYQNRGRERIVAVAGVAIVHAALALVLLSGLAPRLAQVRDVALDVFDVPPPPPPVPKPMPTRATAPERDGATAPPHLRAVPSPVVAPLAILPPPPVIVAPPVAAAGVAPTAGGAAVPGPGTGAGGIGAGLGSGVSGAGTGGGGTGARLIKGRIANGDYPRDARRDRLGGTVTARFTVGIDGRATGCAVSRSSGVASLDSVTCALIEKRFRYAPARDNAGKAVPEERGWRQDWWLDGAAARRAVD